MSFLPRCLQCGKVPYKSLKEAEKVALELFNKDGRIAGAYYKPKCGNWHLTTTDLKRAAKNREVYGKSKIQFRDYQLAAKDFIYKYFQEKSGNPIVAMPTGTGKSLVIAGFIHDACTQFPGTRVVMLTHVKELIEQNMKALLQVWPTAPAGIYSAGLKSREYRQPICFAGIQSVYRKAEMFGRIDLVLVDECHLVSPKGETMYRSFLNALLKINPNLKVIGFSATAFRLGQGMLTDEGGLFTDICFDLTSREAFNWMIAQGWLSPLIPKQTSAELDVSDVRIQGGEFVLADLQEKVDREAVTMAALREASHLAQDRNHWLVFASGIQHAEHVADYLETQFGITAAAVHSKITDQERTERIRDFKSGKIRALVNNNILTTGFDYPNIDCIVMLRPTASPGLWVQMLGRGTRPCEGKRNCLVLDFAGNTKRLGPINDPVLPRRRGKGPQGLPPVRLCEVCGCYSHASCRFCENPECGAEFPRNVKIVMQASTEELVAGVLPKLEKVNVDRVIYTIHKKVGKPDSMKVTYHCGFRTFREYICLDHGGYARHKAKQWWEMRIPNPEWGIPPNVHAGMAAVDYLRVPKQLTIWPKREHSEIVGYEFE